MFEAVRSIVNDYLKNDTVTITPETSLLSELNINSLELVELVDIFEEEFRISIEPKDMYKFATINDIVSFVEKATEQNS